MVWRLRVLTFYILISIVVVSFFATVCLPIFIFKPSFDIRYRAAEAFSYVFIFLIKWICGINYEVEGLDKLPQNRPFIACPNHQSFWENVFVQLIIPKHTWVIKRELFNIPIFGPGLKIAQPIAVDRNNSRSVKQILEEGQKKIDQGLSIVIFPEGTRVKPGRNVKLKPSAAKLAINAGAPISIIVHDAGKFWPKGFWFTKPGTIKVKVVETIPAEKVVTYTDARQLTEYMQNVMHTEKDKL